MNKLKPISAVLAGVLLTLIPATIQVPKNAIAVPNVAQTATLAPTVAPAEPIATPIDQTPASVDQPVAPTPKLTPNPVNDLPDCDQRSDPYCYGTHGADQYGTPTPAVKTTLPKQPWLRDDGYFNYCFQLSNGTWTTSTGKLTLGKGVYYYGGEIDPATQAPAYADASQAWCAANVPLEAQ